MLVVKNECCAVPLYLECVKKTEVDRCGKIKLSKELFPSYDVNYEL